MCGVGDCRSQKNSLKFLHALMKHCHWDSSKKVCRVIDLPSFFFGNSCCWFLLKCCHVLASVSSKSFAVRATRMFCCKITDSGILQPSIWKRETAGSPIAKTVCPSKRAGDHAHASTMSFLRIFQLVCTWALTVWSFNVTVTCMKRLSAFDILLDNVVPHAFS